MASLLKAGRGAVRILTKRTVSASLPRPTALDSTFDCQLKETIEKRDLWEVCIKASSEPAKPRPVLPMEIRFDREQEVPIVCRAWRPYFVEYAMGEPGLVHPDLNKYWVEEVLQELYTEAAGQAGELGEQMDATLQVFQKFGSMVVYQLGTCCVRDKDGKLSVVVDDKFCEAVLDKLFKDPKKRSKPRQGYRSTGYIMRTVSKTVFEQKAFKVVTDKGPVVNSQSVQFEGKFKGEEAKMAVEVDRSALGQGNLLFFLPEDVARNKFEVFVELVKAGDDVRGLELLELYSELSCWYKLLPLCKRLP